MKNKISLFTGFIYPKSSLLDSTLKTILSNYSIVDCTATTYDITITFENKDNKVIVSAWNTNKWYAWLSRGYVRVNDKEIYRWDVERPSRKTMNLLLQKILEYNTKHIIKL